MITSIHNQQIKKVIALGKKRERAKTGHFVIEGLKMIQEVPKDWIIDSIFVTERFEDEEKDFLSQFSFESIYTVEDKVFQSMADTMTPQGILAVVRQKAYSLESINSKKFPFYLLVEEMQDPGNLGTLIRTADAAGADGVILSKGTVDLYNPKVLRATMGSIFHLPIIQNADMESAIYQLQSEGIKILAAHLEGIQTPYEVNLQQGIGILIGNEANGIKDGTAKAAEILVKLPMVGKAESLNAAVASGILMYEVVRQRNIGLSQIR